MTSPRTAIGLVWLFAVAVLVLLVAQGEVPILPHAFLVAWLVLVSLPLGALPVLMGLELVGRSDHDLAASLRLLLATLPVLSLAIVPILLDLAPLYPWAGHAPAAGTPVSAWFASGPFTLRAVLCLVVWNGFALFFLRPARPSAGRRSLATAGLLVHLVLGTLAAFDWFMSLDAGFVSSTYGVLVIAVQCAFAIGAAMLTAPRENAAGPDRAPAHALLVAVAVASFLQFAQYLVVWSANLPKEIVWYQTRAQDGVGAMVATAGPGLVALAALVLAVATIAGNRISARAAVVVLVIATVADLIVLASPGDTLTAAVVLLDVVVGVALAGLVALSVPFVGGHLGQAVRDV